MAQRPPAPLSPQARRQAQQQALQATLARRDQAGFTALLAQWAHRHGVSSLQPLLLELGGGDPEGMLWWNALQEDAQPNPAPPPAPVLSVQPEPVLRELPKVTPLSRPAPAPSHPALAQLRSWLPDQEATRAA
ncbi:MAG: hypothetical protein FJ053_03235 [Cyanobacteria bacterium M_surface_10_m1_298]|nr:hypothetical protein [Cyanobacteria bacterium M_surface_10_m1_298]